MPMLWGDRFIGWANASLSRSSREHASARLRRPSGVAANTPKLDVTVGFVNKRPRDAEFRRELDAEIARLADFLGAQTT